MDYLFALDRDDLYALICGVALGILIGITVCYMQGFAIPDSKASLWGAAVGSVGAVAGAFMLWSVQQQRAASSAAKAVVLILTPLVQELDTVQQFLSVKHESEWSDVLKPLERSIHHAIRSLGRFDARWQILSPAQFELFLNIEATLDELQSSTKTTDCTPTPILEAVLAQHGQRSLVALATELDSCLKRLLAA